MLEVDAGLFGLVSAKIEGGEGYVLCGGGGARLGATRHGGESTAAAVERGKSNSGQPFKSCAGKKVVLGSWVGGDFGQFDFCLFLVDLHGRIRKRESSLQKKVGESNSYSTLLGTAR